MKRINAGLTGSASITAFSLGLILTAAPAVAQDEPTYIEEIVVQAQRRDQNLSDVPVSVSVVTGAEIDASGIKDMFDMQQNVPGLIVGQSQTTTSSNFAIRGIGSTANNFGVESSVGLYVDGVYRSRQSSMVNELIDVQSAEVLRGPQGTLFGKNTAAGAILIRTVAPDPTSANAYVDVTAGDYGLARISAATNIGLTDDLAMRATVFTSRRDGYVSDLFLGEDIYNNRDRFGLRMQLGLNDPSDDFNMRIILDYAEIDENCCVAISRVDGLFSQASVPNFPALVPGSDAAIVSLGGTVFTSFPYPDAILNGVFGPAAANIRPASYSDYVIAQNYAPLSQNEDRGISVEMNKAVGDLTFSSVSAYRAFDTFDRIDGDFTNVDVFERTNEAAQTSFSQEFRLSGDIGDKGSFFQVGVYYFGQEIESITDTNGGAMMNNYVLAVQPDLVALINGVNAVSAGSGGALPPAATPFPVGTFAHDEVDQDHDAWAVFGQTDIVFSEKFTLTLGARYTDEKKDITGIYTQTAAGPVPDLNAIGLNLFLASQGMAFDFVPLLAVMQPNNGWGGYLFAPLAPRPTLSESVDDDQFTGTVKLSFYPSESTMVYASFANGFKSGGTNTDRISPAFSPIFGAETSESFEVGFKGTFDRFRIGFSYYMTDYDDFQANSFTGTGFNLQNAGKIETDGWELEYTWQPFDHTTISGYFAQSTGDFTTFVGGTCWDQSVFHTGQPDPGSNGDPNAEVCDRSGGMIPYNPEDRAFIALTQDFPLAAGNLFFRAEYTYASELFTDGDLDPFTIETGTDIINLRLGMDIDSWNSRVTLWGRNITDERTYHGSFDQPLGLGRMNSYPTEPATYGISFMKNWD